MQRSLLRISFKRIPKVTQEAKKLFVVSLRKGRSIKGFSSKFGTTLRIFSHSRCVTEH